MQYSVLTVKELLQVLEVLGQLFAEKGLVARGLVARVVGLDNQVVDVRALLHQLLAVAKLGIAAKRGNGLEK